ncbi:GDP-mannose 4,6-dehydratase [Notoacmeibacter marinus]|uniref:GDP-mannose 4,6-dehydratase n=1 Tax=Notoacmeibacter marinus TaxID=1876515 RepID=UPI000DF1382D|nr:GDP-mannose 4,6-dehydratase [Notoacmeibacter marinus]
MERILVTGGAGYLGSHICYSLAKKGYLPVAYDDLSTGRAANVRWGPLQIGDIGDKARLETALARHKPLAVIHLADRAVGGGQAGESSGSAFGDTTALLSFLADQGLKKVVLSGWPSIRDESAGPGEASGHDLASINRLLDDSRRHSGIRTVMLRHLETAGCEGQYRIERSRSRPSDTIGRLAEAVGGTRDCFRLYGCDHPTRDGTFVGDHLHVMDAAAAYVEAVDYLIEGGETVALDLGTGRGASVRDLIELVRRISGSHIEIVPMPNRSDDRTELAIDPTPAQRILNWSPSHSLRETVMSAVLWSIRHRGVTATAA